MKTKLTLLLLFALALLIGCSSDDDGNDPTGPNVIYGKNTELLGFWQMTGDDQWQSKPITFGENYCLYADENGFRHCNWKTSNTGELILESLAQEATDQQIYFEYAFDGVSLQLTKGSETLTYQRPAVVTTVTDSMVITYDIAAGVADLILLEPNQVIETLAEDSHPGTHRVVWYPDPALENGSYALDIQRTINDTIFTICRKYVYLNR